MIIIKLDATTRALGRRQRRLGRQVQEEKIIISAHMAEKERLAGGFWGGDVRCNGSNPSGWGVTNPILKARLFCAPFEGWRECSFGVSPKVRLVFDHVLMWFIWKLREFGWQGGADETSQKRGFLMVRCL